MPVPGAAYTEKTGTYVNTEGRAQQAQFVVAAPGKSRENWQIIRAISEVIGAPLPYDDVNGVRARMAEVSPTLTSYDRVEKAGFVEQSLSLAKKTAGKVSNEALKSWQRELSDFYMTNPISRASLTMARCVQSFEKKKNSQQEQGNLKQQSN